MQETEETGRKKSLCRCSGAVTFRKSIVPHRTAAAQRIFIHFRLQFGYSFTGRSGTGRPLSPVALWPVPHAAACVPFPRRSGINGAQRPPHATMRTSVAAANCRGTEQPRKAPGGRRTTPGTTSEGAAQRPTPNRMRAAEGAEPVTRRCARSQTTAPRPTARRQERSGREHRTTRHPIKRPQGHLTAGWRARSMPQPVALHQARPQAGRLRRTRPRAPQSAPPYRPDCSSYTQYLVVSC